MKKLFSERHAAGTPRVVEAIDEPVKRALVGLVEKHIYDEWFGYAFPKRCLDGDPYAGTDRNALEARMKGFRVLWPEDAFKEGMPTDEQVFDLIEFSYELVAEPSEPDPHDYFGHSHYRYNQESGRNNFSSDVNRIFERNGIAFELQDGEIVRLAPAVLDNALATAVFHTGDGELDELLKAAREKFTHRSLAVRRESLEKLWDAWERLKTVEPGGDKKTKTKTLLDKATTEPLLRQKLEAEALELTDIGNKFMIRHAETDKVPVKESSHIDYLFHRLFSLIRLLLQATGRGG